MDPDEFPTLSDPAPLRLRHPPPTSRLVGQALWLILVGWLALILVAAVDPQTSWDSLPLLLWSACALVVVAGARAMLVPRSLPPIRFLETAILLPRPPYGRRPLRVGIAQIFDLHFLGGSTRRLVLGVRGRFPLSFRVDDFETPDGAERLCSEIREKIGLLADGPERLRALERRARVARVAFTGTPWFTWVLLGLLVTVYLLQGTAGGNPFFERLVVTGANSPLLVAKGEWFRLVTANLLHFGLPHLLLNGVLLLGLGYMLERLAGRERFATLVIGSGIAGAGSSALLGEAHLSVGFSTSVFGLVGALAYLNLSRRAELPAGLWIPAGWGIGIAVVEVFSEWLVPGIDHGAHLGGGVAGWVAAWLMFRARALSARGPVRVWRVCAALAGALAVVAIGAGLRNAYAPDPESALRVADAILGDPAQNPFSENEVAWLVATSPGVSRPRLEVARDAMQAAAESLPGSSPIRDTLATLHFRLGDFDLAVEEQIRAYLQSRSRFMASQLARFEAARLAQSGAYRAGSDAVIAPELRVEVKGREAPVLVLESRSPLPEGAVVHFVAFFETRIAGHVRVRFGPAPELLIQLGGVSPLLAREGMQFELSRFKPGETGLKPGRSDWQIFDFAPEVAALP